MHEHARPTEVVFTVVVDVRRTRAETDDPSEAETREKISAVVISN